MAFVRNNKSRFVALKTSNQSIYILGEKLMPRSERIIAHLTEIKRRKKESKLVRLDFIEDAVSRKRMVAHYKDRGLTVVWNGKETVEVASQEITISTPPVIEIKPDLVTNTPVIEASVESPVIPEVVEEVSVNFPDELLCPHCSVRARTEASYSKNHGDNCHQKPE
jgi:hypothetical protein